ncbi:acyltransferase [Nocardia kruczakiae]|uniref:acyltransferase n=1 Tax=Nocardia kruczakiae TaxID=261477 RepID=UPI001428A599|nr:acyltransferase [Nocardia kruczakiae]
MSTAIATSVRGTPTSVTTESGEAAQPRPSRPYLHQVNLFRILTFASVIAVHVIDRSSDPNNVSANGVMVLLHFPREAFFTLTGFVLIYQYADRSFDAPHFWRRRFALVGIPYVLWSVFYWGYSVVAGIHEESAAGAVRRLAVELVTGEAWYQLYFLLVSMQIYLLFPLLLRFVRWSAGHHRWVLATSALVQAGMLGALTHPPTLTGMPGQLWDHLYVTVLPYQFYILFGAVAAWHIGTVDRAVRRFGPLLILGTVLVAAGAEWCYQHAVAGGTTPWQADNVFNPYMAVYFVALIVGLYTVSTWWSWLRPKYRVVGRISRYGADRSFAVFLMHPIVLELLIPLYPRLHDAVGAVGATALLFVAVLAVTLAIVGVVRHAPGSIYLTGRPRIEGTTPLGRRLRSLGSTAPQRATAFETGHRVPESYGRPSSAEAPAA